MTTDGRRVTRLLEPGDSIPDNFRPVQNELNLSQLTARAVNVESNTFIPEVNLQIDQNQVNAAIDNQVPNQPTAIENISHNIEVNEGHNQLTAIQNILNAPEDNQVHNQPDVPQKTRSRSVAKTPVKRSLKQSKLFHLPWKSLLPIKVC